jgi:hypothetical protein
VIFSHVFILTQQFTKWDKNLRGIIALKKFGYSLGLGKGYKIENEGV